MEWIKKLYGQVTGKEVEVRGPARDILIMVLACAVMSWGIPLFNVIGRILPVLYLFGFLFLVVFIAACFVSCASLYQELKTARSSEQYAETIDGIPYFSFLLTPGYLFFHVIGIVLGIVFIAVIMKVGGMVKEISLLRGFLYPFLFGGCIIGVYTALTCGYAAVLDLTGGNLVGRSVYTRYETARTYRENCRRWAETCKREQEEADRAAAQKAEEEKRKEDATRAKAEEARRAGQEQARQHRTYYEANLESCRAKVREWLNWRWQLGFPDDVCDLIADYTEGEEQTIAPRLLVKYLMQHMPEEDALEYGRRFGEMQRKARELELAEEESRERSRILGEDGEQQVEYRLKWWQAEHQDYRIVARDCTSKYSEKCIRVAAWDYVKEPQELDHLLVGPAGVVHIETKNYVGRIRVVDTDTWDRDKSGGSDFVSTPSPAFQVRRHDAVLRHILGPDVPLYGIICIANEKAVLTQTENSEIPVLHIRSLESYLNKITADGNCDTAELLRKIEAAKVRKSSEEDD